MRYLVLGVGNDAALRSLEIEAADARSAQAAAAADGLAVVEVRAQRKSPVHRLGSAARQFRLDLFCQELLALLSAGIMLGEAVQTLADKEVGGGDGDRGVLRGLALRVREGQPLSAAMAQRGDVFPSLLVESMRASERTSDYVPALQRFVSYRQLAAEVRSKLVAASIYPAMLLGVSAAVLLFLVGYVVPRFSQVYADMGDRLPAASRALLWIGQTIDQHPWQLLGSAIGLGLACVWVVRSPAAQARASRLVRRLPQLREVLVAADLSRMYRTLALLLHGGIAMVPALQIVRGLLPAHMTTALDACRKAVSEGRPFSDCLREQGLSTVVADRFFRVGEQTGRLAEMIDRAAEFHEGEVARAADWAGRVVGPVLMLVMGVVIGLVVVLMYLPIFQLAEAIQ